MRYTRFHKLSELLRVAALRPAEAWSRLATIVDARLSPSLYAKGRYQPFEVHEAVERLTVHLGAALENALHEKELSNLEGEVLARIATTASSEWIPKAYDVDAALARFCYALCRAVRPVTIVETGVARGVTSAYILQALEKNGAGLLVSVDLPPLGADPKRDVGSVIPERLRSRWELHLGSSKCALPAIMAARSPINMFVHDSLHTYRNMRREFGVASPHLAKGAVLLADDIEGNEAFQEWLGTHELRDGFAVKSPNKKKCLFGIGLLAT